MGIGALTIPAAGVVAQSSVDPFPLPETPSFVLAPGALLYSMEHPWRFAQAPGPRFVLAFNGVAPVLNLIGSTLVRTGLLAPYAALTVAGTGTKASARFDTNHGGAWTPTDGDYLVLVSAGDQTNHEWRIYFATAALGFATSGIRTKYWQVAVGANVAACLDNLKKAINGTGIDGTDYRSPTTDEPGKQTADHPAAWSDWITATTNTDTDQSFEAVAAGQKGNTFEIAYSGSANPRTEVDGADTATAVFTAGTAGTGTAPAFPGGGLYVYGYGYARGIDGALSGISPVTEHRQLDPGETDLSVMADPPANQQEGIDVKVWYRTTQDGPADVLYEGYRVAVADLVDDDNLSDDPDDGISAHALYDPAIYRSFADGIVPRRQSAATLRERIVSAGHTPVADYSFGEASFTNGSNIVTLVALGAVTPTVTKRMEGRLIYNNETALLADTKYRVIYTVDASNQVVIDRPYEGTTDANAAYVVTDRTDAFESIYTEPKLPNNWPSRNSVRGPLSPVPAGVTAVLNAFESILEWTATGLWRFTGSDRTSFRINSEYEGAGCVGRNAACEAEGWVYWLSGDAIYRWGGSGVPECLSSQRTKAGDLVGVRETVKRINQAWIAYSIAHYCPATRVVRFFIPLDDEVTNRWALVYDIQTGTWALDHYGFDVLSAWTFADQRGGALRTVVGTLHGDFIELDVGTTDCAFGAEPVGTITSSTRRTATCSAGAFLTSGNAWKGVPVAFIDASGNVTYNTIESNTGTILTFTRLMDAAPTGKVIVGAVHALLESGRFHANDPAHIKGMPNVRLIVSTDVDGQVYFSVAGDQDDPAVVDAAGADLTVTDGEVEIMPLVEGRFLKIRIDAFEPGCEVRLLGLRMDLASGSPAGV